MITRFQLKFSISCIFATRSVSTEYSGSLFIARDNCSELKTLSKSMLFINLKTNFILRYPGNCLNCNQSAVSIVETKEPIRSREISKFWRAINERTLIGSKEAGIYLKDGIKQKIKSVDSRNRDLAIRIKGIQYKSFHGKTGRYNNKSTSFSQNVANN